MSNFHCAHSSLNSWVRAGVVFVAASGVLIGPLLFGASSVRQQMGEYAIFPFENTNSTVVSLERLFVPSGINPLFWEFARITFPLTNGGDGIATFGYLVIILFIVALRTARSKATPVMVATFVVGLSLMLGTTLHFWGRPITLTLIRPEWVQPFAPELVQQDGSVAVPMPAYIAYKLFSPFRTFHGFSRWGLVVAPVLAAGAALGITEVARRIRSRRVRYTVGLLSVVVLLVEFNLQPLPVVTTIDDMKRSADEWLAMHHDGTVLVEYPLNYTLKGQTLYYTLFHKKSIVHGYSSIPPAAFAQNLPLLAQWPSEPTLDLLQQLGVDYVLINVFRNQPDFEQITLPTLVGNPRLELIDRFDDAIGTVRAVYLFRLVKS